MLKEHEPPKEPVHVKASRKWANAEMRRRIKEEREKPKLVDPNRPPEIADVISNDGNLNLGVNSFERRFKKDIRAMMEGYTANNKNCYIVWLESRKRRLLKEKLRRLLLAQREQEVSNV